MVRGSVRNAVWAALLMCALFVPAPAEATFPGQNGKIAFVRDLPFTIHTINPDGTGEEQLIAPYSSTPAWSSDGARLAMTRPDGAEEGGDGEVYLSNADGTGLLNVSSNTVDDSDPAWSPDGSRFVFQSTRTGASLLWVMNADGSGPVLLGHGETAEWSPDGTRIVLRDVAGGWHLETIRPDGTGRAAITPRANLDSAPSWSPDGRTIVFRRYFHDPACPRFCDQSDSAEVWTVQADGSDPRRLTTAVPGRYDDDPEWSPDGSRIAFLRGGVSGTGSDIYTMNPDGSGVVRVTTDNEPKRTLDWQPLPVNTPSSHVRPKGATPLRVPLVPAFTPCETPNRTHGPPLAFGSCGNPSLVSTRLTVGASDAGQGPSSSTGLVRLDPVIGATGPPDDTDVRIHVSATNVMRAGGLSDYTGELEGRLVLRVTDEDGAVSSTWRDLDLSFAVPCAETVDPSLGAACQVTTAADAVMPGLAAEGSRAVWALVTTDVRDGGPDEDADTAGNSRFLTQGVFVP